MKFLIAHRRNFHLLGCLMLLAFATTLLTGCAAAWLTDAGSILFMIGQSMTSVAAFVAALSGNTALAALLTTISEWITTVQAGIADLQTLIAQYKANASTGLLADIEAALATLQTNVKQDFSNLGLPPAVLTVIAGIAGLATNLLAEWSLAINGIKTAATSAEHAAAYAKMSSLADALPASMAQYKTAVNGLLTAKTGDPATDAALAKVPLVT